MRRFLPLFAISSALTLAACEARESHAAEPSETVPSAPARIEVPPPAPAPESPAMLVEAQPAAATSSPAPEVAADAAMKQALSSAETRVAALRSAVTETCDKIAQLGESAAQELKDASADLGKRLADVEQLGTQLRDSSAETWTALDQGLDAAADELDDVLAATKSKLPR